MYFPCLIFITDNEIDVIILLKILFFIATGLLHRVSASMTLAHSRCYWHCFFITFEFYLIGQREISREGARRKRERHRPGSLLMEPPPPTGSKLSPRPQLVNILFIHCERQYSTKSGTFSSGVLIQEDKMLPKNFHLNPGNMDQLGMHCLRLLDGAILINGEGKVTYLAVGGSGTQPNQKCHVLIPKSIFLAIVLCFSPVIWIHIFQWTRQFLRGRGEARRISSPIFLAST